MKLPDFLTNRRPDSAKWDYGHALLVAGAYGRYGCALLAGRACLRTGVGLLTMHAPRGCVDLAQEAIPEAMLSVDGDYDHLTQLPPPSPRYSAIAIGPGIGTAAETAYPILDFFAQMPGVEATVIYDADALTLMARTRFHFFCPRGRTIFTPHVREMERFGCSPEELSRRTGATILLKGHTTTVYSADGRKSLITTGNAGMATGGSGDVLTGILLGLAAQNEVYSNDLRLDTHELALLGAQIHGIAGQIYAKKHPECALVASDLVENIPDAIRSLSGRRVFLKKFFRK